MKVVIGNLVAQPVEAIVNAANSQLWMGGGVAGAIKAAAGVDVEREAMTQGPIRPGDAVVTSAGKLAPPIRWVVHAATMGPDLVTSEDYIRRATGSALAAAANVGAGSIAFPALGTGVGGFPLGRAARVMVSAVRESSAAGSVSSVVFVVRSQEARDAFQTAIASSN